MPKSTSRTIYLDQSSAEVALEKLIKQTDRLESSIKNGNKAGKDMAAELTKLGEAKGKITEIQNAIDKGLRPSIVQQKALVTQLRNELRRMSEDAPGQAAKFKAFASARDELKRMELQMNGTAKAQSNWFANAKTVAFGVLIGNTVQSAIASIGSYLSGLVSGNAKLSDELANIEKASGLSAEQVKVLNSELSKINTRTSTSQLREIAVGLGQIGQAVTPENVAAIDKIVVALGDEFGGGAKEITTVLSILRNNLKDIKTQDYGTDVARIGNALNELGAKGLATAPVVTDFANRMAGIATTFKLTSGQILGTAATFQELGINVERGSTAFVKILQKIAAEPKKFTEVAGLPIKEFTELINKDLLGAFVKVAEGAKAAGADNVAFGKIMKELDTDGSGAGEVLSKIAQNAQLLSEKVDLASVSLQNTSSITAEFDKKNNNLAANLEKMGKRIGAIFTNGTIAEGLRKLVVSINQTIAPAKTSVQLFDELDKKVKSLDKDITPLINRYDVLSAQTKLSATEQSEMKSIVEQVASTIPSAITQVDAYGNAIAISTGRVREYIATERDRLKVVNEGAIRETQKAIAAADKQFQFLDQRIKERNAKGFFGVQVKADDGTTFTRKSNETELRETDEFYQNIISKRNGLNAELKRLNGEALQESLDASAKERATREKAIEEERKRQAITFGVKDKEDPRIKLLAELKRLQDEAALIGKDGDAKELERILAKYKTLIDEAIKYSDIVIELEKLRNKEVAALLDEISKKQVEEKIKQEKLEHEKTEKILAEIERRRASELESVRVTAKERLDVDNRSQRATGELNVLTSPNAQRRLAAQLQLLEIERDQELQNTNLIEEEKEVIREEYRQRAAELQIEFYADQINQVLSFTQEALNTVDQFFQAKSNKENARLQKELKQNDQRRTSYKKMLDQRLISEQEYQRKVNALNEDDDKKKKELSKKQFNRQKALQITMALINGAMAVTSTLAALPGATDILTLGAFRAIQIGIAIAATAASVAAIASKKAPEFAKGGIANGSRHTEGGIDMIDRKSGRRVGNMEGGEPYMILSRNTYANNGDVIDELLDSSMNRNGARVKPFWQNRPYQNINYSTASRALRKTYFETGGIVNAGNNTKAVGETQDTVLQDIKQVMIMLAQTNMKLNERLNQPLDANISYKKIKDADALQARIINDATLKP